MSRPLEGARAASRGCYEASRAAALAGIPKSTLYDWARKEVVVPSISPVQEKLWSYADLISLRIVAWLRRRKESGYEILPPSPVGQVRRALSLLDNLGANIWDNEDQGSPLLVDMRGEIFIYLHERLLTIEGQDAFPRPDLFQLTGPVEFGALVGPDLLRPREHLRIVPEKVAGEPHAQGTRITTSTLAALVERGYDTDEVAAMYDLNAGIVDEAIDLERQLSGAAA